MFLTMNIFLWVQVDWNTQYRGPDGTGPSGAIYPYPNYISAFNVGVVSAHVQWTVSRGEFNAKVTRSKLYTTVTFVQRWDTCQGHKIKVLNGRSKFYVVTTACVQRWAKCQMLQGQNECYMDNVMIITNWNSSLQSQKCWSNVESLNFQYTANNLDLLESIF